MVHAKLGLSIETKLAVNITLSITRYSEDPMQIDSYHLYMTINVCLDSLKVIISNLESN